MISPESNQLRFEKCYPYTYAIIATVASVVICLKCSYVPPLSSSILESGITAAAIFVGFNAVYRNTLQTKVSKTIQAISDTGYIELYHGYLKAVTNSAIRFILVSFIILFVPECFWHHIITFNVWLLFAANMLLCFYRANHLDSILFESK